MVNRIVFFFTVIVCILSGLSCQEKAIVKNNSDRLNKENEIRVVKEIHSGDIGLTMIYRPSVIMAAIDINKMRNADKAALDSITQYYAQYAYFDLILDRAGGDVLGNAISRIEYDRLLDVLLFGMGEQVSLIGNNDTIPLVGYNYPRLYDASDNRMLFVYRREDIERYKKITFVTNLSFLGGGIAKAEFDSNEITGFK